MFYNYLNDIFFPGWDQGEFFQPYKFLQSAMIIASPMIFLIGLTTTSRWFSLSRRAQQLESEKLKAELSYLRSQINPHFFFNTLNNLYGLALKNSKKTPEVVLMLSELMSYIIYEADKEIVPLSKEIEQIERYIALEQVRYENRFTIELDVSGDVDLFTIPPLILLPFVENSFKHGVNKSSTGGWIAIKIEVEDDQLKFKIENETYTQPSDKSRNGGLGIENVKKRLNLLFPENHILEYGMSDNRFIVDLTLKKQL